MQKQENTPNPENRRKKNARAHIGSHGENHSLGRNTLKIVYNHNLPLQLAL